MAEQRSKATYWRDRVNGPEPTTERGKRRRDRKIAAYVEGRPYSAAAFKRPTP